MSNVQSFIMSDTQMYVVILLLALSVWITRFLPFMIFRDTGHLPGIVEYLGRVLPAALMGLLVVYCFKDYSFTAAEEILPAIAAAAAVVIIHLARHNTILSITVGTVLYMILIRLF